MKRLYIVLLFLMPLSLAAQSHWQLGLSGSYAMPNNFNMMEYARASVGFDATWYSRQTGSDYWRLRKHYPAFGVRGSFAFIPNAIYGHRFGVVGLVQAPLGRWVDYHLGLGFSSYTRPQCLTGDEENIFISSILNCFIDVGFDLRLGERYALIASLLHSSNGMLRFPNKGLNFLQFGVAVKLGNDYEQQMDWLHSRDLIDTQPAFDRTEWNIAFSPGTVMSRDTDFSGYYFCYDLAVTLQHYVSPTFAFGGTVDLWYNFCDTRHLEREEGVYNVPLYVSAMAMMEFFWGPLSVKAGAGPVIVASPQVTTPFYERAGAYYNFGHNFIGVAVNAHGGRVEFIEWTFGRRFPAGG